MNARFFTLTALALLIGSLSFAELPAHRVTSTGHVFTSDDSHPELGEAWLDPSGMSWMKTVLKLKVHLSQREAKRYCEFLGALLPNKEDFIRLREYMGAKAGSSSGYHPEVLDYLTFKDDEGVIHARYFWTSEPDYYNKAFYFSGLSGYISSTNRDSAYGMSVMCVWPKYVSDRDKRMWDVKQQEKDTLPKLKAEKEATPVRKNVGRSYYNEQPSISSSYLNRDLWLRKNGHIDMYGRQTEKGREARLRELDREMERETREKREAIRRLYEPLAY